MIIVRFGSYDLDIEDLSIGNGAKCLLQLPAGLIIHAKDISEQVASMYNAYVMIHASPTYGACDIPFNDAK